MLPTLRLRILGQHAEEITPERCRLDDGPRYMRTPRRGRTIPIRTPTAHPRQKPGLRTTRREHVGAPAYVPDVRPRRLLRLEPASARERTFSRHRPSSDALGRAG